MTSLARAAGLVAMLGALSACGSEGQTNPLLLTGKAIKARLTPQDTTPADPTQAQVMKWMPMIYTFTIFP